MRVRSVPPGVRPASLEQPHGGPTLRYISILLALAALILGFGLGRFLPDEARAEEHGSHSPDDGAARPGGGDDGAATPTHADLSAAEEGRG